MPVSGLCGNKQKDGCSYERGSSLSGSPVEGIQHLKKAAGPCHQLVYRYCPNNQGTFRRYPPDARTAVVNAATGKVIYTPPEGETIIRDKLKNLEDFIHIQNDIDPLIKLALIHYQFEAIHHSPTATGGPGESSTSFFLS